ncbi:MAG: DUF1318 domain-containing protein [Halopseudomonas sp.]
MGKKTVFTFCMLLLLGSGAAWALSLNEAMSALPAAKEAGQLGEQPDGYLGVIKASGNASEVAQQINAARKEEYQRVARDNGIALKDVETIAGQKAIDRTPAGQYIKVNGGWVKK